MFHHLGSVVGGLIIIILVGCGNTQNPVDPAAAYREIVELAERGDWGAIYDRYDQKTRAQREQLAEIVRKANPSQAMKPREQHVTLMQDHGDATLGTMRGTLSAPQIDGNGATLTLTMADGKTRPIRMTREGGRWMLNDHFDFFQSIADRKGSNRQAERHVWQLKGLLRNLRSAIHTHRHWNDGRSPDVIGSWDWSGLAGPPANPLSPPDVATRIIEVTTTGARWDAVDPSRAGWIWNSADGILWASGFDDDTNRITDWKAKPEAEKTQWLTDSLERTRRKIAEYQQIHAEDPDLIGRQWSQFGEKFMPIPTNPQSPRLVWRRVVEVTEPGVGGAAIDPADAGYVWNSADGTLHLAGFDESAESTGVK